MMSWIDLQKSASVSFGITQEPLYITPFKLGLDNKKLIKKFFWNCFETWRETSH